MDQVEDYRNNLSSFASSDSNSNSSFSSSEDSDGDHNEWDKDTNKMVEVFIRSVRLPDFLLTH